jgi:hypothetical protein
MRKGIGKGIIRLVVSLFYSFLGLSLLILIGCGDPSGDPTATLTLTADKTTGVVQGESVIITATVIRAVGQKTGATGAVEATETPGATEAVTTGPAYLENVNFTLLTANGGSINPRTRKTDINGVATTVYTAGYNDYDDEIQAKLDNGTTAFLFINKTGTTITVTASPTSVSAGQASVVTATLTGNNAGVTVTFTMPVNNSGGHLSASSAVTDGSGQAQVSYTAGSNSPTQSVSDTVQASAGSISGTVAITRTGTATTALSITVAASPASVSAGHVSIVTATVTGDDNVGVTVTFSLSVNNSGATLSATSAVTDGSGKAQVTYTAGANNPTLTVDDTVQAAVDSISGTVVITRTGTATTSYTVTVSAVPTSLATDTSNSVITANVKNNLGTVVSGVTVTFTVTGTAPLGTVSPLTATTDSSGNAGTVFTGGGVHPAGETNVVTATITVSGTQYTGNVIITYP